MLVRSLVVWTVCLSVGQQPVAAWVPSLSSSSSSSSSRSIGPSRTTTLFSAVEEGADILADAAATTTSITLSPTSLTARDKLSPEYRAALDVALTKLQTSQLPSSGTSSNKLIPLLAHFLIEYLVANQEAMRQGQDPEVTRPDVSAPRFMTGVAYGLRYGLPGPNQYRFGVTHTALRGQNPDVEQGNTIDFYAFGCDFFRPCMNLSQTKILGRDRLDTIFQKQLAAGENVILFANHQSEADPQVVSVCLEQVGYGKEAEDIVYVAGHKVTTDPLAIPFSMGRNLICIHSKKHIDADPATKPLKQKQNLLAMNSLLDKLKAGGCMIWVAPSGGRDRRNVATGEVPLAPFDAKTIDIFRLFGNKSRVPTHYYTLAMVSYDLCPPPDFVEAGVGEERNVRYEPVGIAVGEELASVGGLEARHEFTDRAFAQCQRDYDALLEAIHGTAATEGK